MFMVVKAENRGRGEPKVFVDPKAAAPGTESNLPTVQKCVALHTPTPLGQRATQNAPHFWLQAMPLQLKMRRIIDCAQPILQLKIHVASNRGGVRIHNGKSPASTRKPTMLGARNQFKGTVKSVKVGGIMAEVVGSAGGIEIVSAITRTSAEQLGLKVGDQVTTIIKSTEVIMTSNGHLTPLPTAARAWPPREPILLIRFSEKGKMPLLMSRGRGATG
jgi:molybdopterin-binding protein